MAKYFFPAIIISILFSLSANAGQEITEAFGIALGQYFDTSNSIGKGSLSDGTPMYKFNPKKAFVLSQDILP